MLLQGSDAYAIRKYSFDNHIRKRLGESKITPLGSSYLENVFSCTTRSCTKVDEMIQLLPTVCKNGRMGSSEAAKCAITQEE